MRPPPPAWGTLNAQSTPMRTVAPGATGAAGWMTIRVPLTA
jgi:hypothetical protein